MPEAWLDGLGLHLSNEKILKKVSSKPVSASMITAMLDNCSAKYIFDDKLKDLVIPKDPSSPLVRGSAFHRAAELYYSIPQDERGRKISLDLFLECRDRVLAELEPGIAQDADFQAWLDTACRKYCAMGPRVTDVDVARYRTDTGEVKPGLEMVIVHKLDGIGRKVYGSIDRLRVPDPARPRDVIVDDYKTGRTAKRYSPARQFPDFGYIRQQVLYAMLLEADTRTFPDGFHPLGGQLIYPVAAYISIFDEALGADRRIDTPSGLTIKVDVHNPEWRQATVDAARRADLKLTAEAGANCFSYTPHGLCPWCPLARICPAARIKNTAKAQAAFAEQPDAATLAPAIVAA